MWGVGWGWGGGMGFRGSGVGSMNRRSLSKVCTCVYTVCVRGGGGVSRMVDKRSHLHPKKPFSECIVLQIY